MIWRGGVATHPSILQYLFDHASGEMPRWLSARVCGKTADAEMMRASCHYLPLASEQREDGGYGRFHSMNSQDKTPRQFRTTEQAVQRMRDLMLPPDDPVVLRVQSALLGYADGSLAYSDRIERHPDFDIALGSMALANAAALGSVDERVERRKAVCAQYVSSAAEAIASGNNYEAAWRASLLERHDLALRPETIHVLWLLWRNSYLEEEAEYGFLRYLWGKSVYYTPGIPARETHLADSAQFARWLFALEQFSGARTFPRLMQEYCTAEFLEREALKLIGGLAEPYPNGGLLGRYQEGRRTKSGLIWDTVLRIARLLRAAER
jgi:hypothetical protein